MLHSATNDVSLFALVGFTFELNIAATGSLLSTRARAVPVFLYFDSTKGTTLPAASADCGRRKPT